jgi:hypothetical protein
LRLPDLERRQDGQEAREPGGNAIGSCAGGLDSQTGGRRGPATMRPVSAMTLGEVMRQRAPAGERKRTSVLKAGARDQPVRCASPSSPSAAALPPLPAFMSCPELLSENASAASPRQSARTAAGEESDFSSAASMLSGRSTVMPSMASTPTGSSAPSPRHWWTYETPRRYESEDADSGRDDDDSVSTVSSISAVSTCSERSTAPHSEKIRRARPHTAIVRSSAGSSVSLDRAQSDLACLSLGRSHVQLGDRMPAEFETIFSKARHGRYKEVNELLEAGALLDGVDERGNTPLHAACQGGSLKTVKTLLRRGCETNAQNYQGNTPLHYAFAYKYEEVAQYLVRKGGALTEIRNIYGLTACEGLGNKLALEPSAPQHDASYHSPRCVQAQGAGGS